MRKKRIAKQRMQKSGAFARSGFAHGGFFETLVVMKLS